jgi:two-component system cell cycle sensor histidine kinase/response regulator CckA
VAAVVAASEIVTAAMNALNGWIWWGRIDRDLLIIGMIDAFVAAAFVAPIAVLLIRHAFDLQDVNHRLREQMAEKLRVEQERRDLENRLKQAEKMESLGALAGRVAHDLNNILSGLVGYPDWLLEEVPPDSPLRQPLVTIKESGERAAAVVQDMLTLARRGVRAEAVVSVNKVVSTYVSSLEFSKLAATHPHVAIETRLADTDLANVRGSAVQLGKALMNLVTNACEAAGDTGRVLIETERAYVDTPIHGYETIPSGHYVLLGVSDTGRGIAPQDLARVFEPFYTRKAMGRSGTGLGLAVVWGAVKDHAGYIDVRSAPGEGSAFRLFLPATTESVESSDGRDFGADERGRGETVLVVDDLEEQRQLASALLGHCGYSTRIAAGGEEAIEYIASHPVDLVLLDMIMDPGPDGLETYERIVRIRPGQRAVIASGFSETDRVRQAMSLGAGTYLRKPYTAAGLGRAVRRELDRPSDRD